MKSESSINLRLLIDELDTSIKSTSNFNLSIISNLFPDEKKQIKFILEKIFESNTTECVISYGSNNQYSKLLCNSIIAKHNNNPENKKINISQIYLDALFHTSEDTLFYELAKVITNSNEKGNFVKNQKSLEEYFEKLSSLIRKNKKTIEDGVDPKTFFVIYFSNIEHLFNKKRQIIFYSLLEILAKSNNTLFIGMTNTFNLVDNMEKRVRSRFSHSIIQPCIKDKYLIYSTLSNYILKTNGTSNIANQLENENEDQVDEECLVNTLDHDVSKSMKSLRKMLGTNPIFVYLITKLFNLGVSVSVVLTKLKFLLTNINFEFECFLEEQGNNKVKLYDYSLINKIVENEINKIAEIDENQTDYYLLKGK